jgi:hypothetical protein
MAKKILNSICENYINLRIPSNKGKFLANLGIGGFLKTLLYGISHQSLVQSVSKVFAE